MQTIIRTAFPPSDAGGIVLPNLAALRRTLYAIGELLGVTPRQVQALITATERIRLAQKSDDFSEKMLTNPQDWHWDDHHKNLARDCHAYSPDLAWSDDLVYLCARTKTGRVHLAGVVYQARRLTLQELCTAAGIELPLQAGVVTVEYRASKPKETLAIPVQPLYDAVTWLLRKPALATVVDKDFFERAYEAMPNAVRFSRVLGWTFTEGENVMIGDDPAECPPRYGHLMLDAVDIGLEHTDPLIAVGTPFELHVCREEPDKLIESVSINLKLLAAYPHSSANNQALREQTQALAQVLRRAQA